MNRYILTYSLFEKDEFRPKIYQNFKDNVDLRNRLLSLDKKKFNDLYPKYKWYTLNKTNKKQIKNNLFSLVNLAYDDIGGHVRISSPEKVQQDDELDFWMAMDNNNDPYATVVIFGKKTQYGVKISGIGHNRTLQSKIDLFNQLSNILKNKGYYLESSHNPAQNLLFKNTPFVKNINAIRKIFNSPEARYIDSQNMWYEREVNGITVKEILFGNPII